MNLQEAIESRHSVRAYRDEPIPAELREKLDAFTRELNRESGLHISIQYDDPAGFDSRLAHYGSFRNVKNYIVLAGKKDGDFDFRCGYYKKKVKELIPEGESLCMVIALGFGESQGRPHRSKSEDQVRDGDGDMPDWFRAGLAAALLAPTAVNQQKFCFGIEKGEPTVRVKGLGSCTRVDLGIAALHFELGSGKTVRAR